MTNENKLEYIHRVADYRLNVQLRGPAGAFRRGFTSVVHPDWVAMFNEEELQVMAVDAWRALRIEFVLRECCRLGLSQCSETQCLCCVVTDLSRHRRGHGFALRPAKYSQAVTSAGGKVSRDEGNLRILACQHVHSS